MGKWNEVESSTTINVEEKKWRVMGERTGKERRRCSRDGTNDSRPTPLCSSGNSTAQHTTQPDGQRRNQNRLTRCAPLVTSPFCPSRIKNERPCVEKAKNKKINRQNGRGVAGGLLFSSSNDSQKYRQRRVLVLVLVGAHFEGTVFCFRSLCPLSRTRTYIPVTLPIKLLS